MASKTPQTMAKRARELALMERRERKRARKAEAAARRAAAAPDSLLPGDAGSHDVDGTTALDGHAG
jgi:hypothetical protein